MLTPEPERHHTFAVQAPRPRGWRPTNAADPDTEVSGERGCRDFISPPAGVSSLREHAMSKKTTTKKTARDRCVDV